MNEEKDNIRVAGEETEEFAAERGAAAQGENGSAAAGAFGKFKSADALLQAYNSLQAEFTRRSQRLKELENDGRRNNPSSTTEPAPMPEENASKATSLAQDSQEELLQRIAASEELRRKIIDEYLSEVKKSAVPLLSCGVSVKSPAPKARSIAQAGEMALGFFRNGK